MRYTVEVAGPNPDFGEVCYHVNVNEESIVGGADGHVYDRDSMILDEVDLDRMIRALTDAKACILACKGAKS
jgi:hypothetical protein